MTYRMKYGKKEIQIPQMKDITWANVLSKPTTFPPSVHNQDWSTITGKPSTFTPSSHTHSYLPLSGGTITGPVYYNTTNVQIGCGGSGYEKNAYVQAFNGYCSIRSYDKSIYHDGKYIDAQWTSGRFYPSHSGCALGSTATSNRWYRLYAANACNTSSDRRLKDDIVYFDEMPVMFDVESETALERFFKNLKPSTFTMKDDHYKRMKFGFIAQDVIQALNEIGMTPYDVDFVSHGRNEDDDISEEAMYGLCYEEFIALNTHMIQKAYKIIEEHQKEIHSLRKEIDELKTLIFNKEDMKGRKEYVKEI